MVATAGTLAVPVVALGAAAPIRLSLSASRSQLNTTQRQTLHVSGRTPARLKLLVGISPKPCLADASKEVNTRPGNPVIDRTVTGHFARTYTVKHPAAGTRYVCAYLLHTTKVASKTTIVTDAHTSISYTTSLAPRPPSGGILDKLMPG
jgi:hypothetical protein